MTTHKALYKHKKTNDMFAIETDSQGNVISTSGPLLSKDINPDQLDYDNYWDSEISSKIKDFVIVSKLEYLELLKKNGFCKQVSQKHLF
jgi:hypothetical protein